MTQTLDREDTPPPMPLSWRMLGSGEPIAERKIGSHSARDSGRSRAWKTIALDVPPRMKTAGSFLCGMDHLISRTYFAQLPGRPCSSLTNTSFHVAGFTLSKPTRCMKLA